MEVGAIWACKPVSRKAWLVCLSVRTTQVGNSDSSFGMKDVGR